MPCGQPAALVRIGLEERSQLHVIRTGTEGSHKTLWRAGSTPDDLGHPRKGLLGVTGTPVHDYAPRLLEGRLPY